MSIPSLLCAAIEQRMSKVPRTSSIIPSKRAAFKCVIDSVKTRICFDHGTAALFVPWIGPTAWAMLLSNERSRRTGGMYLPDELMFLILADMFYAQTPITYLQWDPQAKLVYSERRAEDMFGILSPDVFRELLDHEPFIIMFVGDAPWLSSIRLCDQTGWTTLFDEYTIDDKYTAASGPIYIANTTDVCSQMSVLDCNHQPVPKHTHGPSSFD